MAGDPMATEFDHEKPPALNPPKQTRSRQTMDRIATAALGLMEEVGVEGATVAAIVERAGSSVGSFYARFPGKGDLVRYLRAGVWTEARERWDQALARETWEGLPMETVVEGVVGLLLRFLQADFQRRKVLGQNRAGDSEASAMAVSFHEHLLSTVTPILLARREEISHPDPEGAVEFGYRVVVGAIREFLELESVPDLPLDGDPQTSGSFEEEGEKAMAFQAGLGLELARLWSGYLRPLATDGREKESGEVDFFDPWG